MPEINGEQDEARLHNVQQADISAVVDKPFEPDPIREILYRVLDES